MSHFTYLCPMSTIRQQRIERMLQKELSKIFIYHKETVFGGVFSTITQVRISPDLGVARVYVSVMDIEHKQQYIDELNEHKKRVRGLLSAQVGKSMRRTPELVFFLDDSLDYAENIDRLLRGDK